MEDPLHDKIVSTLKGKSCLKQDVYQLTKEAFATFKTQIADYCELLKSAVCKVDDRIRIEYAEKGDYACQVTIAGDILVFVMHTNVSQFDEQHRVWNTSYMKADENRGYCGTLHMYNFLADSFRHNRVNDRGYLIGRLFVNKEKHFFVQGKGMLGLLFNDFVNDVLTEERILEVIKASIQYTLDFDLYSPPYRQIQQTTVQEMILINQSTFLHTGKRVGYKFHSEMDEIN